MAGQAEAEQHQGEEPLRVWRDNYRGASLQQVLVRENLLQHSVDGGQGFPISRRLPEEEAKRRFLQLTVVPLGAVTKISEPSVIDDIRAVNDGTHGVSVKTHSMQ